MFDQYLGQQEWNNLSELLNQEREVQPVHLQEKQTKR